MRIPLKTTPLKDLGGLFIFITGSDRAPPLGFSNEPEIRFEVDYTRMPTASTCGPNLHLPITSIDPDMFEKKMDVPLIGAHGFGLV